ncbi:MAG: toxin-antitoxin system protein [bacterium]
MSKLMRINDSTISTLENLSKLTGQSKQKLLDRAVALYAHEQILKKANEQYAALEKDPKAWKEMQDECQEWDVTLKDGLKDD